MLFRRVIEHDVRRTGRAFLGKLPFKPRTSRAA